MAEARVRRRARKGTAGEYKSGTTSACGVRAEWTNTTSTIRAAKPDRRAGDVGRMDRC